MSFSNEESRPLGQFVEQAYLDYSLYVILDRALPFIGDGLKPVQRRIIYAMGELGLAGGAKHKKSARTVGDVIGKYHPHGDSACYEAMVHLAQPFSQRYPLIDGQGNWGSIDDPKSFAAMRYTESRLSPYAKALLQDLETADFKRNFDGSLEEPEFLPCRLPNVLLNGATGIAVGMATSILPHNLGEIISGCQSLLLNPELDEEELLALIPGPDFPTGGVLVSAPEEIRQLYRSGRGQLRLRADYRIEENQIIITALPYQLSGSRIQEQIAKLQQQKKLPLLLEMRDESDHENPVRLVLTAKNRAAVAPLLEHLFASTELEKRFASQMNLIGLDRRPQVKGLKALLLEWLEFRRRNLRRSCELALGQLQARLEVLEALRQVYRHLAAVIDIIRDADQPGPLLQQRFNFNERQLEAVLNMRLRQLAKLEEGQLLRERQEKQQEIQRLQGLLADGNLLNREISRQLAADSVHYGDPRRTVIRPTAPAQKVEIISAEPITVIISQRGWLRAAKGHQVDGAGLSYRDGDGFLLQQEAQSNQTLALLFDDGRLYNLPLNNLPGARGYGEPLSAFLTLEGGALAAAALIDGARHYLVASDRAVAFICQGEDLLVKKRNGKAFFNPDGARASQLLPLEVNWQNQEVLCQLSNGRSGAVPLAAIPQMSKGRGKSLLRLPRKNYEEGLRLERLELRPLSSEFSLQD